ncbi:MULTISPECIES: hypothetical protein [Campylobacter]|uniref:hypothetical protein n=1 Tax=Campylobacter TaxID=194 RepID=UPI000A348A53|nr:MULTISPECIES: hypothetical protein [unclassified Campylobacter]
MIQRARAKTISDEIIEEIGNQTLARFGINIFSLNTYAGYGAAVDAQRSIEATAKIHANNDKSYGHNFEELVVSEININNALHTDGGAYGVYLDENIKKGDRAVRTDMLAYITQAQNGELQKAIDDLLARQKNLDALLAQGYTTDSKEVKDATSKLKVSQNAKIKLDLVNKTYTKDEQKAILKELGIQNSANDELTDIKVFENGELKVNGQLKAVQIRDNSDLKKLYGENNKYLNEDVKIIITKDQYQKAEELLDNIIKNEKDPVKRENAKKLLAKLESSKYTIDDSKNGVKISNWNTVKMGAKHVALTGLSEAAVMALSIIASGVVWEIKDMCFGDTSTPLKVRVKRLWDEIVKNFKNLAHAFSKGGTFAIVDMIVKHISAELRAIWTKLRSFVKQIFNSIHDYITGKIKSFREMLSMILKGLMSALWVTASVFISKQLEIYLEPIMPGFANIVAGALTIVISAFAIVLSSKAIDMALDTIFAVIAERDMAKQRADEIAELVASNLPALIAERESLELAVEQAHIKRMMSLDSAFSDYANAKFGGEFSAIFTSLDNICKLHGTELKIRTKEDLKTFVNSGDGKLYYR